MKKYSITFEVVLADENIHPDSVARVMDMALADFADPTVARWQYMGATEIDAQPSVTDRILDFWATEAYENWVWRATAGEIVARTAMVADDIHEANAMAMAIVWGDEFHDLTCDGATQLVLAQFIADRIPEAKKWERPTL